MLRLLIISLLALLGSAIALSDVNQQCIADNSEPWSNDNLLGTWYQVYKLTLFGGLVPSVACESFNFTRPTVDELQKYRDKYNDPSLPYNLDDNPVLVKYGAYHNGLVTGHNVAKFYVLSPDSAMLLPEGYTVDAYKQLSSKYIMYTECALRGNTRWLLSNDRDAPVAEMEEMIQNTPELNHLSPGQRFCAQY